MLTLWLPAEHGIANTLPGYTSHTCGVGAVVINDKRELLVVQERCVLLTPTCILRALFSLSLFSLSLFL